MYIKVTDYKTEVTGTTTDCAATKGPKLARLLAIAEVYKN